MSAVTLGFRAFRGGSVVVGVALDDGAPRVVLNSFLPTAKEGDRNAFEPFHVAYEMAGGPTNVAPSAAVVALVDAARKRQDALAASGLAALLAQLREKGAAPRLAVLLLNRAGWMSGDKRLPHALCAPEHPPVIEGLAVRDALRFAVSQCGLAAAETDEKSLPDTASVVLGLSSGALEAQLKALGADAGKPWRKEQKLACLAAWLALAAP